MPRNPHKRPCQVPGCKAWAKHGHDLCSSHLASRAIGRQRQRVLPLLRLAARVPEAPPAAADEAASPPSASPSTAGALAAGALETGPLDASPLDASPLETSPLVASPLVMIDQELRQLLSARAHFMEWLEADRTAEGRSAVTPTQFLRAWSDSATRVVQLLRARAELRGDGAGALDTLMQSVYDELEALLAANPDARQLTLEAPDGEPADRG